MKRITPINLTIVFLLGFIEGLIVLLLNLLTPSETQNSILFGFSLQRLCILSGVISISLVFLIFGLGIIKKARWLKPASSIFQQDRYLKILNWFCLLTGFVLFNLLLIPDYQWEHSLSLINRIRPIIFWGMLVCLQFGLLLFYSSLFSHQSNLKMIWRKYRSLINISTIIFLIFIGIWVWMALSGMGIYPDVTFWNVPGVPLLIIQVYGAILLGGGLFILEWDVKQKGKNLPKGLDIILCVFIFLTAAFVWNLTPQKSTVFAPGPYPPNDAYYPHSDASVYNLSAQLALVGAGYNGPFGCPDKSLYITFLTWLNFLAGLDQKLVIILQVCVLSILPVIVYLIGKVINSRSLGVMAAFLVIFKETNAIIGSAFITTSMSKMMMSELPTAISIAAMILCLIIWIKNHGQKYFLIGVVGGIIGLSTMLRLTMNIFIPFVLVIIVVVLLRKWKKLFISYMLFFVVLVSSIAPWAIRVQNECNVSKPLYYILGPLEWVIWINRYNRPEPVAPSLPASVNSQDVSNVQDNTQSQTLESNDKQIPNKSKLGTSKITPIGKSILDSIWEPLGSIGDRLEFISGHFFHNLLTTTVIYPTTLQHDDLKHIADPLISLWSDRNWDGKMDLSGVLIHICTISIIAVGIGSAWKKYRLAGIIPFLVYLIFCLGLAIARTSGGRYIVPIDWILHLYFAGGILTWLNWILEVFRGENRQVEVWSPQPLRSGFSKNEILPCILVWAFFISVGLLIPGTEKVFTKQEFTPPSETSVKNFLIKGGYSEEIVTQSNLLMYSGKAISPRFFFFKQDINPGGSVGKPLQYPRFAFILISANNPTLNIVLPTKEIPSGIRNGTIVSVAGCKSEFGLDAVLIMIGDRVYYRNPKVDSLICPLPEVICNADDRTCR